MAWQDLYRQLSALAMELNGVAGISQSSNFVAKRGSKFLLDTLDEALTARVSAPPQPEAVSFSPMIPSSMAFLLPSGASMGTGDVTALDATLFSDEVNYLDAADIAHLDFSSFGDEWTV